MEKFAKEKEYCIILDYVNDEKEILESIKKLVGKRVSGLIIDSKQNIHYKNFDKLSVYINGTKNFEERKKFVFIIDYFQLVN